jgi:hypothetical protein
MTPDLRTKVEAIISSLHAHMAVTSTADLEVATLLLGMAKLELQAILEEVQPMELDQFCAELEQGIPSVYASRFDLKSDDGQRWSLRRRTDRKPPPRRLRTKAR